MLLDMKNKTEELKNLKKIKSELSQQYGELRSSISQINDFFKMSEQYNEITLNLSIESLSTIEDESETTENIHNLKFLKEENKMLMTKIENLRNQVDFYKVQSKRSNIALQNILRTIHDFESSVATDMKTRPPVSEINV